MLTKIQMKQAVYDAFQDVFSFSQDHANAVAEAGTSLIYAMFEGKEEFDESEEIQKMVSGSIAMWADQANDLIEELSSQSK